MTTYDDQINDTIDSDFTGDDTVIPFDDDDMDFDKFRLMQNNAFGGIYGC